MPLEILTIPCLTDNYAYIAHDADTGETLVIDVPEAGPVMAALTQRLILSSSGESSEAQAF